MMQLLLLLFAAAIAGVAGDGPLGNDPQTCTAGTETAKKFLTTLLDADYDPMVRPKVAWLAVSMGCCRNNADCSSSDVTAYAEAEAGAGTTASCYRNPNLGANSLGHCSAMKWETDTKGLCANIQEGIGDGIVKDPDDNKEKICNMDCEDAEGNPGACTMTPYSWADSESGDPKICPLARMNVGDFDKDAIMLNVIIKSFSDFNEKDMHYKIGGYMWNVWLDVRLAWDSSGMDCVPDTIDVPTELIPKIWKPDLFISNALSEQQFTDLNRARITIKSDGQVTFVREFKAHVSCNLNFARMPWDTQICPINLESFYMHGPDLVLTLLGDDPIYIENTAKINGWTVSNTRAGFSPKVLPASLKKQGLGTYHSVGAPPPMATFEIEIKRDSKYYIFGNIGPAILFVCCCYLAFWIDRRVAPARVAMCIIPLLIFVNANAAVNNLLPKIDYSVWLQDFMAMSLMFACIPTIQYLISSVMMNGEFNKNQTLQKVKDYAKDCKRALRQDIFNQGKAGSTERANQPHKAIKINRTMPKTIGDAILSDHIDPDTVKGLQKLFDRVDTDHGGSIDKKELRAIFNYLQQRPTTAKINKCFEDFTESGTDLDSGKPSRMTFENFLVFIAHSEDYFQRNLMVRQDGASLWNQPQSYILEVAMRAFFLPLYAAAVVYFFMVREQYAVNLSMLPNVNIEADVDIR
jgi:hypothetical protein